MLNNKIVLIIGGSSGLGLSIAKGFAGERAKVIIAGRTQKKLDIASKDFKKSGLSLQGTYIVDVACKKSVEDLRAFITHDMKKIDIVICAAGIHLKTKSLEMSDEEWCEIINTNLTGTYYVNNVFGSVMVNQGAGSIINIASLGARVALSDTLAYNVSKSGVEILTKTLGCEWALKGVRVNAILPGVFETPLNRQVLSEGERAENILRCTPMRRFGKLEEIVSAALFLASDKSSFVTGTSVVVDGGFLAYAGF